VLEHLLENQHYLCCYTEMRITWPVPGAHIEHVLNKSQFPNRTFDISNLAASVLSSSSLEEESIKKAGAFGGHARGKSQGVDPSRFISCYDPDCTRYFAYLSDGRVVPAYFLEEKEKERANYTIKLLHLNSSLLVSERREWWDGLEQGYADVLDRGGEMEEDFIKCCFQVYNKKMDPFISLSRQFFEQKGEKV
jgi:uncharacterized protein (TIGR02646 family)